MSFRVSNAGKRNTRPQSSNKTPAQSGLRLAKDPNRTKPNNDMASHDTTNSITHSKEQETQPPFPDKKGTYKNSTIAVVNVSTSNSTIHEEVLSISQDSSSLYHISNPSNVLSSNTNDEIFPKQSVNDSVVTPRTMESTISSNCKRYKIWRDEHGGVITFE